MTEISKGDYHAFETGIALSGGGYRAAAFGLGALLYLVDAGINKHVEVISSVSGGSIINGFVMQECDFASVDRDGFEKVAAKFVNKISRKSRLTYQILFAYSAILLLFAVFIITVIPRTAFAYVLTLFLIMVLAFFRGKLLDDMLSRIFFSKDGKTEKFGSFSRQCTHIFCATDLSEGTPVFFLSWCGGYLYSKTYNVLNYGKNWLPVSDWAVSTIVRASATFPFLFTPCRVVFDCGGRHSWIKYKFLADGGISNNLGTQWWDLLEDDYIYGPETTDGLKTHEVPGYKSQYRLLAFNASSPLKPRNTSIFHMPIIGEFAFLFRIANIIYSNTVTPRTTTFERKVKDARRKNDLQKHICISINEYIGKYADDAKHQVELMRDYNKELLGIFGKFDEKQKQCLSRSIDWQDFIRSLGDKPLSNRLDKLPTYCSNVTTTLLPLTPEQILNLIILGYIRAMEVMHVEFAGPIIPDITEDRFVKLFA